ncbi:cobalt import ATP-binding protein CbiO 2 [Treponema primitia ZAS-2]|uniref:Cobalt import ATP-binding protein CbiO 2 n=1 Tax=Treponema primitia (strain ATCC BAA-887 / DSM 12427 / ZAS-2) TaxID=545694 RepID=F5YKC1_TREPZ|nr:ABC transporter ATP-binding protein [Treponema primitia]AEF86585.1 cobalt import ATP-binding protein CbiO 2 [Treponema primitia ZAS-2]
MAAMNKQEGPVIEACSLSAAYDGQAANGSGMVLREIAFAIQAGERVALVGANGAGKTSLLLTMVGILPIASGSLEMGGVELGAGPQDKRKLQELRSRVSLVFQDPEDQLFMPSIYEDLAFGPRNMGLSETEVRDRVDEVLDRLGISFLRDRSPLRLSGGEKRLAAIAASLTMNPSILLFDEPTAFLDPKARRKLMGILQSLPHTQLIATHDLDFAASLCPRVILLQEGAVFAQGPAEELLRNGALMDQCGLEAVELA